VAAPALGNTHSDTMIVVNAPAPASLQADANGLQRGTVPVTATSPGGTSPHASKAVFGYK
jgi:hypothetical protein